MKRIRNSFYGNFSYSEHNKQLKTLISWNFDDEKIHISRLLIDLNSANKLELLLVLSRSRSQKDKCNGVSVILTDNGR